MDGKLLRELITTFLLLNSEPSDAQVHALAGALGIDKESLEATMYEMLSEEQQGHPEEVNADEDSTEVLEDEIPEERVPADQLTSDGKTDPEPTLEDQAAQMADGSDAEDTVQDLLIDDGVPVMGAINVSDLEAYGKKAVEAALGKEHILQKLDPVMDSLMHGLQVLQKEKGEITAFDSELNKPIMATVNAIKNATTELHILIDDVVASTNG